VVGGMGVCGEGEASLAVALGFSLISLLWETFLTWKKKKGNAFFFPFPIWFNSNQVTHKLPTGIHSNPRTVFAPLSLNC